MLLTSSEVPAVDLSPHEDPRRLLRVTDKPVSLDEVFASLRNPRAGGIGFFLGIVRDHDLGRGVATLDYSAHPSALEHIARLAAVVAADEELVAVSVVHRVGQLSVGDIAVAVGAAAQHRRAAIDGARRIIDTLKAEVPLWKQQTYLDGSTEWIHCA